MQDAVATLVDLGNRGVLRMTQIDEPTPFGTSHDYELERLGADEANLRQHERLLLITLFGEANRVRLSQVRGTFAAAIPGIQAALHQDVAQEGLFVENPDRVRTRYRQLASCWRAWEWSVRSLSVAGWRPTRISAGCRLRACWRRGRSRRRRARAV